MLLAADMRNEAGVFQPDSPMAGKLRTESSSSTDSISTGEVNRAIRTLELERVKEIFQGYDLIEASGAVACVVCGRSFVFFFKATGPHFCPEPTNIVINPFCIEVLHLNPT